MSSRWNWDSPTPLAASECALPPVPKGGGAHSPAAKGVGESQLQRLEKRLALCLLCGVGDPCYFGADPDPYLWLMDQDPDPFSDFKDAKNLIFSLFFFTILAGTSSSVWKINFCAKINENKFLISFRSSSDPDPVLYTGSGIEKIQMGSGIQDPE